jgi:hypothetical protein
MIAHFDASAIGPGLAPRETILPTSWVRLTRYTGRFTQPGPALDIDCAAQQPGHLDLYRDQCRRRLFDHLVCAQQH